VVLDAKSWGFGAHLKKRVDNAIWSGNLSYGETDVNGFDFDHWSFGIGYKYFDSDMAYTGQVGYTDYDDVSGLDGGMYARAQVDYYFDSNLKFYGSLGIADYDFVAGPGNLDVTGGDFGIEYKPKQDRPFVYFANLSIYNYDFGGPTDLDMRNVSIGVKFYDNDTSTSIRENDEDGAYTVTPMRVGLRHTF